MLPFITPTDYEYIAEHIELSPYIEPSHAKVRLDGGVFSIGYTKAYTAAWQQLLHRTQELAIPILYLQRHHLELAVKDTLQSLLAIRYELQTGHEVFGWDLEHEAADKEDWRANFDLSHSEHAFEPLFNAIDNNLRLLRLPELPSDFQKARTLFQGIEEEGKGTRFRYALQRVSRKTTRVVGSFPDGFFARDQAPMIAKFDELSAALGQIACVHCRLSDGRSSPPSTFWDHLAEKGEEIYWTLAHELSTIEELTRRRAVVWEWTSTPRLDLREHADFKERSEMQKSLHQRYLVADYNGQRLVILILVGGARSSDGSRSNEYLLARQLDLSGALSPVVSLEGYQSNLIIAVGEALSRQVP
jgi:hypothetical protein